MRSHKGSITIVSLTLLVILSPIFLHQAFAAEQGMTLMATANAGSNTISISGHTANPSNEVSIVVTSPNGNIVTIDQVTPNGNGDYATTIQTNSALWKQDGLYKITAQQSSALMYTLSLQVEISGGTTAETSVSQSSLDSLVTSGVAPTPLRGLTMEVDAGGIRVAISGHTDRTNTAVTIVVKAPNGNIVTIDQVTPNGNGDFATTIQTNSALWKQDGLYKITSQQSSALMYTLSVQVEISGGTTAETSVSQSSLDSLITGGVTPTPLRGLTMEVDAGGIRVAISGHTDRTNTAVTIVVKAPNGNIVTIDQVTPNGNGDYATTIQTNSALWKQDGFYTVSAQHVGINGYSASAQVEIADGAVIPEFGTIAVMILAVAIISIIAVSSRSRLNLLPKY